MKLDRSYSCTICKYALRNFYPERFGIPEVESAVKKKKDFDRDFLKLCCEKNYRGERCFQIIERGRTHKCCKIRSSIDGLTALFSENPTMKEQFIARTLHEIEHAEKDSEEGIGKWKESELGSEGKLKGNKRK